MELDNFYKNTRKSLGDLSKKNDAYIHFRAATSISLLVGFPLVLYWVFNGLLVQCFSLFLGKRPAVIAGVAACFLIGVLLLLLMPMGHKKEITIDRLPGMLASNNWKNRVAALQYVDANKIDLQQFDLTRNLSQHPSIPVLSGLVDLSRISHIRIIDVVGDGSALDSTAEVIYDPYPTTGSAGFDLDALGVSNGAPYPEGEYVSPELPPEDGDAGFGGETGCFVTTIQ